MEKDEWNLNHAAGATAALIDSAQVGAASELGLGVGVDPAVRVEVVRVPGWERFDWLRHGFSTRAGGVSTVYQRRGAGGSEADPVESQGKLAATSGDLNLGWTADDLPELVAENRRRFTGAVWANRDEAGGLDAAGAALPTLITVRQVHSAVTLVVGDAVVGVGGVGAEGAAAPVRVAESLVSASGRALAEGDGLITAAPGLLLGVQTADCTPVLVVDTARRVVAGFHAGWRGTVAGIVEQGIARMRHEFGSRPEDLLAAVGPAIGACCYTVGDEVSGAFHANFDYAAALFQPGAGAGQYALDLWEANRRQLLAAGIAARGITVLAECTGCAGLPAGRRYFSHRAEQGFTGRMLNAIGVTERLPGS